MLIDTQRSCLLVIDVQEKLVPAVQQAEQLIANCRWMIEVAQLMSVPVLASEQYPRGVGHTVDVLRELIPSTSISDKLLFSCADAPATQGDLQKIDRDQIVLVGMEAHVCVLQTAVRLQEQGKQVYVVADATSSRSNQDKDLAIARMRSEGIQIVSREMVGFEWLRRSDAEQFKTFGTRFLK